VLDAASRLLRERGLDVTMQEIADEAGVGVGTVCRRFRTKDELVAALVDERIERLLAILRRGLEQMDDDPWQAFSGAFTAAVELHARDRGFSEALAATGSDCRPAPPELRELLDAILARAIDEGVVRPDLTAVEIPQLACMVSHTGASAAGPAAQGAWRRTCEIVLDGMRA
jgi:AcrR family transcriptional regulator